MVGILKKAVTLLTVASICMWSSASAESTEVVSQTGSDSVAPAPAPPLGGGGCSRWDFYRHCCSSSRTCGSFFGDRISVE